MNEKGLSNKEFAIFASVILALVFLPTLWQPLMYVELLILGALLVLCIVATTWDGKCEKCGSWNNWHHAEQFDDHPMDHPDMTLTHRFTKCEKCHHEVDYGEAYEGELSGDR
jgi:hypothetical protein